MHNKIDNLWEYGTCWVTSPVTDAVTIHEARKHVTNKNVQFFTEDKECDNGFGFWLDFNKGWWKNYKK